MVASSAVERGDAGKLLEWFRAHRGPEFADLLDVAVEETRKGISLR